MTDEERAAFQPAEQFIITTLETLKVFSDPLRQQILETLLDGAKTVKQIAAELTLSPTKLYYHVNLLEEHGLIRVTDTRIVSGIIEKQYRASARSFEIRRSLLLPGQQAKDENLDAALDAILNPIRRSIHISVERGLIDNSDTAPMHRKLFLRRGLTRLSQAQAEAFYERLDALIKEFEGMKSENDDGDAYRLLLSCFPVVSHPPTHDEGEG
jgi:DNA-binding transcriptional ArsR family regulator